MGQLPIASCFLSRHMPAAWLRHFLLPITTKRYFQLTPGLPATNRDAAWPLSPACLPAPCLEGGREGQSLQERPPPSHAFRVPASTGSPRAGGDGSLPPARHWLPQPAFQAGWVRGRPPPATPLAAAAAPCQRRRRLMPFWLAMSRRFCLLSFQIGMRSQYGFLNAAFTPPSRRRRRLIGFAWQAGRPPEPACPPFSSGFSPPGAGYFSPHHVTAAMAGMHTQPGWASPRFLLPRPAAA